MKVVAFNGSGRSGGNTLLLIQRVSAELKREGIETELVELAGETIKGCTACYGCFRNKDGRCVIDKDIVNGAIAKMAAADGIIIGSPTYFADITSETKALIDRSGMVARANDFLFRRKVGAAVIAARRAGAIHAFSSINHFFLISEMIVPGSSYWNIGIGREIGDVAADAEGLATMETLGRNMAWLMKKLRA
ncbi:MAG TPA: flavodoxin family protein [Geobacter sp.]|nr:flavodoxin family protein [Geobacter sp.]